MEGTIEVTFVTSNPENRLFVKVLERGDVFVVPRALVHYQRNVGNGHAVAISCFNSQFPGAITLANVLFASQPAIPVDVLAKAFQVKEKMMFQMKSNVVKSD